MQTPHHGSKKAWDTFSTRIKYNALQVVPFGGGNRYGHPNSYVIENFEDNNLQYKLVSQLSQYSYKCL